MKPQARLSLESRLPGISTALDEDIIEHFKQGGAGYQSRINDVLRAYVTAKRLEGEGLEGESPE